MLFGSDKFDQLKKADKAVKSPKYLQEVMGIGRIAENGIFQVGKGYVRFSEKSPQSYAVR